MSSEEKKTQTEINNFRDLRFAYLHSKFWTHNSLQVPNQKVILNEDFVEFHNVVRIPEQIKHLNIYWINKGIAGEICVPGQWNYAYVDGKFYHMVKMHSQGFIEGVEEEGHMYNLIYDDWQNDWMNNTFYLKGTIELTGDPELVRENIHQTSPMFENMNGFRFLNGVRKNAENDYKTVVKYPKRIPFNMTINGMSTRDKVAINNELKKFHERKDKEPNEERLNIPFLYKVGIPGNWKGAIINGLDRHRERGFQVFDVATNSVEDGNANFRVLLENMLGTTELYTMSSHENRVFTFAKTLNPTKGVPEIDLSGCTDIIVLDRLYLTPLYGIENRLPTFKIEDFVNGIIQKQGGHSSYKDDMIKIFEDTVVPALSPIVSYDEPLENKIFRNVTLEKIDRDVVTYNNNVAVKNPPGIKGANTRLIRGNHHKNNIGDNTDGIIEDVRDFTIDLTDKPAEEINKITKNYREYIEKRDESNPIRSNIITKLTRTSNLNSLIYLPDEYKLVAEEGNNDDLDFSKNLNELLDGFALIPDYDRKTHTLAYKYKHSYTNYKTGNLIFDPKNPIHANRTIQNTNLAVLPVIFDEIINEDEEIVQLDGEKPSSDFFIKGLTLGLDIPHPEGNDNNEYRNKTTSNRSGGAVGLSRGTAFYALSISLFALSSPSYNKSYYVLRHKPYGAKSYDDRGSRYFQWEGSNTGTIYGASESEAQFPEAVYEDDKREGRRFITEYSFPVKTDDFSIIDILREYDDIPDNFLRGEIINSNIKKGTIKKYMRTVLRGSSGRLSASRFKSKEEETKIPKNTVVMIGLCQRMSGSPAGDNKFDEEAVNKYTKNNPGKYLYQRMYDLQIELNNLFFQTRGENGSPAGAIPIRLRNESEIYPSMYPKDGGENGRSQMSLSYGKPHKGIGYIAGTRFLAPLMTESLRFTYEGYLNYDKQGTEDGIMAIIPNPYRGEYPSDAYNPRFTFRERANRSISSNAFLAFLHNNFITTDDIGKASKYTHRTTIKDKLVFEMQYGGNYTEEQGNGANYLYERFQKYFLNGNTLTLNDYIKNVKTYKTNRLDNPKFFPPRGSSSNPYSSTIIGKPGFKPHQIESVTLDPIPPDPARGYSVAEILNIIDPIIFNGYSLQIFEEYTNIGLNKPLYGGSTTPTTTQNIPEIKKDYFTPFNEEVPPFIIKYMTLTDDECILKHGDRNNDAATKEERMALFKEKLGSMVRYILNMLESGNTFIKFEGTNGYASIKLNTKEGYPKGDYELFTNEKTAFKTKDDEKGNFVNHIEKDIDVLINTRNELSIHGNKLPFKSRKYSEEPELDLGLHVKALDDITQTEVAVWYAVTMDFNEQDVFQTFIEVPKIMTKQSNYSPFEREQLIRKIGLRGEEYLYNKNMIEYQKTENKFTHQYEQDYNNLQRKYGIARGVMKMIGGGMDMVIGGTGSAVAYSAINGVNPMGDSGVLNRRPGGNYGFDYEMYEFSPQERFTHSFHRPSAEYINFYKGRGRPPNRRAQFIHTGTPGAIDNRRMAHYALSQAGNTTHGLGGIIDGALSIGEAIEGHTIREEYRKQKFDLAEKKLSAQGDILNRNYEFDRKNMLDDLWAMSANVIFPQINANIVYKLYNKHFGLNDIHMIQYYPKGKLLQYIKNYYREFGYNILVRDFECTGVESIINHLRYQYIKEINHPNISITEMIQARALAGIKVIPWTQ